MDRTEAQGRADRVRAFEAELAALEREGVLALDEATRARVAEHHRGLLADLAVRYDVDVTQETARLSLGMRVTALLGAVALIAAVVFFFLRVWGSIPVAAQVLLLAAAPLLLLALAEAAMRRRGAEALAGLFALVATGAFVLTLAALQPILSLPGTPHAFLAWGLFGLAVGFGYGFRLPTVVGLSHLAWWLLCMLAVATGGTWRAPLDVPERVIATGVAVFAAGLALRAGPRELPPMFRLVGLAGVFLPMLVLSVAGRESGLGLAPRQVEIGYQLLTLATSAGAIWLGVTRGWRECTVMGALAFIVLALIKSVDWLWDWIPRYLYFLLLGMLALLVVMVLRRLRLGRSPA
ncbi:MAG TPA: DUF2157 domain-containing protein [Gemmatimonadales bacterium]|nr:DUF2157 domain-containing protein [Gemmatimonadales bacterium]